MPVSQLNITADTPLGANLAPGGVTFRAWGTSGAAGIHCPEATDRHRAKFFSE